MTAEHTFIVLFSIATAVAIAVSRTRVPYTVALVVVGLAVGSLHFIEPPRLTKELLFSIFLPGLIFEAAYNIHAPELRRNWRAVSVLAGPGVIASILIAGFAAAWVFRLTGLVPDFSWRDGLVFAALVSATDPVAVVSLFRKLGLDARLTTLVEAESLFNDGTSIVALTLILAFVSGPSTTLIALVGRFVLVVCGGAAVGAAVAYVIVRVTRRIDDPMIEITLTTIAAYGSFVFAEDLHMSGVIATVAAGLVLGTAARESAFRPQTRAAADAFWQYIAFALNSIVFLLIGFEVRPMALARTARIVGVAFAVVLLARAIVVYGTAALLRHTSERLSSAWSALIAWGGLRGALAMVLALALPADFPRRALLIDMTFGVVIASLLIQGLTIPFVAMRLPGVRPLAAPDGKS
ncbi:MAG: cation:proton antiporter [Gemmatimonadaceae bacterium]